jgi:hypothetical protein
LDDDPVEHFRKVSMSGKTWWLALACGAILALPCAAQEGSGKDEIPAQPPPETEKAEPNEAPPAAAPTPTKKSKNLEDPPLHRWGGLFISLAAWSPSPVGAENQIAIITPGGGAPYPLMLDADAHIRESWVGAYLLPKEMGAIVMHYDSMNLSSQENFFSPGQFIYYESEAFPEFRGAFDDGLADGVSAGSTLKTREFRLEFQNTAWDTKRTHATWGAGVHSVDNSQSLQTTYYAIVPNLPPVIPPIIDPTPDPRRFAPLPDVVFEQSDFSGSGVGASLDVEFVLFPRLSVVSGLSIGLLKGETSTYWQSQTSYYYEGFQDDEVGPPHYLSKDELFFIMNNGTPEQILGITQISVTEALSVSNASQAAQTFDLYVGLESRIWRGLKVFATFREMYYQNVGARNVRAPDGTIKTTSISFGYEGYLLGLSWRF